MSRLEGLDTVQLLTLCEQSDQTALDEMFSRVYRELRALAHHASRSGNNSLGTTSLIHEAYLKLRGAQMLSINDRRHFCRTAARAMKQILINAAEAKLTQKRGSGHAPESLIDEIVGRYDDQQQILDVGVALESLRAIDARMADVVELRYFAGYTAAECAELLDLSVPTVQRDWRLAKAWLVKELECERIG